LGRVRKWGPYQLALEKAKIRHFLTERQIEILQLSVFEELTAPEIADRLSISLATVRFHMSTIRDEYERTEDECRPTWTVTIIRYIKELDCWDGNKIKRII
jgi:transcriptional regulator